MTAVDPLTERIQRERSGKPPCSVPGCEGPAVARGMCGKHIKRVRRHGSPDIVLPRGGSDDDRGVPAVCPCPTARPDPTGLGMCEGCHKPIVALMHPSVREAAAEAFPRSGQVAQEVARVG